MNTHYFIDDVVLREALRETNTHAIWKTTYRHFKPSFILHAQQLGCTKQEGRVIYRQAFALLIYGIRKRLPICSCQKPLFQILLTISSNISNKSFIEAELRTSVKTEYLAGEILIQLIAKDCAKSFRLLAERYQETIRVIFNGKYKFTDFSVDEVLGESLMILKKKIAEDGLKLPMQARLFTFFYHIVRNKFLQLNKKRPGEAILPLDEKSLDDSPDNLLAETGEHHSDYLNWIIELWPVLALKLVLSVQK